MKPIDLLLLTQLLSHSPPNYLSVSNPPFMNHNHRMRLTSILVKQYHRLFNNIIQHSTFNNIQHSATSYYLLALLMNYSPDLSRATGLPTSLLSGHQQVYHELQDSKNHLKIYHDNPDNHDNHDNHRLFRLLTSLLSRYRILATIVMVMVMVGHNWLR